MSGARARATLIFRVARDVSTVNGHFDTVRPLFLTAGSWHLTKLTKVQQPHLKKIRFSDFFENGALSGLRGRIQSTAPLTRIGDATFRATHADSLFLAP